MQHSEGTFTGVRNATIYYQAWLPDGAVKGVLLVVHDQRPCALKAQTPLQQRRLPRFFKGKVSVARLLRQDDGEDAALAVLATHANSTAHKEAQAFADAQPRGKEFLI